MIKVPMLHCLVKLDVYTTTNVICPPHEMYLLKLQPHKEVSFLKVTEETAKLDPNTEYNRLARKYGIDGETNRRWVEVAFGQAHEGRLKKTMKQGAKHYLKKNKKKPDVIALSPQQKSARTRAANRLANLEKEANAKDSISATG